MSEMTDTMAGSSSMIKIRAIGVRNRGFESMSDLRSGKGNFAKKYAQKLESDLLRCSSDDLHQAFRQRAEEGATVTLRQHARIEDDDDPAVLLRADQPAHALPQLQDRLGQRVFGERIAALRLDEFQPRFDQRMVRHRERQPRDDDIAERLAGHIDAAPKTLRPEE